MVRLRYAAAPHVEIVDNCLRPILPLVTGFHSAIQNLSAAADRQLNKGLLATVVTEAKADV
jgi:hypothetical protein